MAGNLNFVREKRLLNKDFEEHNINDWIVRVFYDPNRDMRIWAYSIDGDVLELKITNTDWNKVKDVADILDKLVGL